MSEQVLRVGVIGTGFGSQVQVPGFQRSSGVEVVAVASASAERARATAARFGVPAAYSDYRAMLAEQRLDLVSIATPPYLHHEMALAALERGLNVLCEKPFASNLNQAREMLAAASRAGVVHAVDHEFRYLPPRYRLKQLVDEGFLGELRTVRVSVLSDILIDDQSRPWTWWSERDKDGGILGALGSHLIDSLSWWFGPIVEVAAQLDTFVPKRQTADRTEWREVTSDDQVAGLLRLGSGAQVNFLVSGVARPGGTRVEAYGSHGTLIIDEAKLLGARGKEPLVEVPLQPLVALQPGDDGRIAPFLAFLERLMPHLRGKGGSDVPTFREGVYVQAVMDAMHRSAEERRFVTVESTD